eukprot:GHVO01040133.1.p1 GENE.GHVO01040133.1~~GHVO01040133.1.p1  ORF type:complete len:880 (+),score=51.17 GHVO01040133.1:2205-4844(+)
MEKGFAATQPVAITNSQRMHSLPCHNPVPNATDELPSTEMDPNGPIPKLPNCVRMNSMPTRNMVPSRGLMPPMQRKMSFGDGDAREPHRPQNGREPHRPQMFDPRASNNAASRPAMPTRTQMAHMSSRFSLDASLITNQSPHPSVTRQGRQSVPDSVLNRSIPEECHPVPPPPLQPQWSNMDIRDLRNSWKRKSGPTPRFGPALPRPLRAGNRPLVTRAPFVNGIAHSGPAQTSVNDPSRETKNHPTAFDIGTHQRCQTDIGSQQRLVTDAWPADEYRKLGTDHLPRDIAVRHRSAYSEISSHQCPPAIDQYGPQRTVTSRTPSEGGLDLPDMGAQFSSLGTPSDDRDAYQLVHHSQPVRQSVKQRVRQPVQEPVRGHVHHQSVQAVPQPAPQRFPQPVHQPVQEPVRPVHQPARQHVPPPPVHEPVRQHVPQPESPVHRPVQNPVNRFSSAAADTDTGRQTRTRQIMNERLPLPCPQSHSLSMKILPKKLPQIAPASAGEAFFPGHAAQQYDIDGVRRALATAFTGQHEYPRVVQSQLPPEVLRTESSNDENETHSDIMTPPIPMRFRKSYAQAPSPGQPRKTTKDKPMRISPSSPNRTWEALNKTILSPPRRWSPTKTHSRLKSRMSPSSKMSPRIAEKGNHVPCRSSIKYAQIAEKGNYSPSRSSIKYAQIASPKALVNSKLSHRANGSPERPTKKTAGTPRHSRIPRPDLSRHREEQPREEFREYPLYRTRTTEEYSECNTEEYSPRTIEEYPACRTRTVEEYPRKAKGYPVCRPRSVEEHQEKRQYRRPSVTPVSSPASSTSRLSGARRSITEHAKKVSDERRKMNNQLPSTPPRLPSLHSYKPPNKKNERSLTLTHANYGVKKTKQDGTRKVA